MWVPSLVCSDMREEICPHLRASNMPNTSIDEVVMDVDQIHKYERIAFKSSVGIIESFIDSHKYKKTRGAQRERVGQQVPSLGCG